MLTLGRLGQISMLTRDAARAEAWYSDVLGLSHLFTFGPLVFFDCDGTRLFLSEVPDESWRPSSTLYFEVADIRDAHASLEAQGVQFTDPPQLIHRHADTGVEEWMAFFDDPDGNTLAIMSKVPPA